MGVGLWYHVTLLLASLGEAVMAESMVRKGKLAVFESINISETIKVTPTKIGVYTCYINLYLHEVFEPIPID